MNKIHPQTPLNLKQRCKTNTNLHCTVGYRGVFVLPKLMVCECEKLPLGLAPPTIRIRPLPPSSDGINEQVWPTLTPGALPLGIREYLSISTGMLNRNFNFFKLQTERLFGLNLLTRHLLLVYLLGRALEETPFVSKCTHHIHLLFKLFLLGIFSFSYLYIY